MYGTMRAFEMEESVLPDLQMLDEAIFDDEPLYAHRTRFDEGFDQGPNEWVPARFVS